MSQRTETEFFNEWMACQNEGGAQGAASALSCHVVETELANQLNSKPGLEFDRLVVRRLPGNSICLEGTMKTEDGEFDIEDYVKCLLGVDSVINRLLVKQTSQSCGEDTVCSGEETVVDW